MMLEHGHIQATNSVGGPK